MKMKKIFNYVVIPIIVVLVVCIDYHYDCLLGDGFMRFGSAYHGHASVLWDTIVGFAVDLTILIGLIFFFRKLLVKKKRYTQVEKIVMTILLSHLVMLNHYVIIACNAGKGILFLFLMLRQTNLDLLILVGVPLLLLLPLFHKNDQLVNSSE